MNKNRNTPILIASSLLFLTTWCATPALGVGPSLSEVPTLPGDTSNEGRAITRDGQYVVGNSTGTGGTRGFLYWVGGDGSTNVLSSDGAQSQSAVGVGYRTAPDPANPPNTRTELIIAGMTSSGAAEYMTADGGVTFGAKRRNANWTYGQNISAMNQVGSALGSDAYYTTSRSTAQTSQLVIGKGIGGWVPTNNVSFLYTQKGISSDLGAHNGISANGVAVGWRGSSATQANKRNYKFTWNGGSGADIAFFNGLAGTDSGEAMSVSADGTVVFGRSRTVSDASNFYGYKVVNPGASQTIGALPEFANTGGSVTRAVPYGCTADGRYAVGMNYRGMEKAVVWNTTDPDPTKWTVLDLTDLASANGFLGPFTGNLRRVYSAGTNGAGDLVLAGWGYNTGAAAVRAFLMTLPEWIAQIGFPDNQSVNQGANATIAVKTNGTDALSFQWYKNGSELSGATSTSLTYNNVSCAGGEAGTYSVVVNNTTISQVVTGAMTLTVLDPYFTTQPSPSARTNAEGSTVIYSVAANGSPTVSYQWTRNGADLSDGPTGWGSTIAGASTATLTISNVQAGDGTNTVGSGIYRARATTSAGGCSTTSQAVTLKVLARPVLQSIEALGGGYRLTISGPSGQQFSLLYTTDLALPISSWTVLNTDTFLGGTQVYDDFPSDPKGFYILRITYQ